MPKILNINSYSSLKLKKINSVFSNNKYIRFEYIENNNVIISFNLNMHNCIGLLNTLHIMQRSIEDSRSYSNMIEISLNSSQGIKFYTILMFYRYDDSDHVNLIIKTRNVLNSNIDDSNESDIRIILSDYNIEQMYDIFEEFIIT